ncbi:MAG: tetratricopeptide repeat protein, partial [Gemmatimonadaceae bacterium]
MAQAPVSVLSRRPDTPPALAELVMRCLEKDPSARPDSAGALLSSLDAISQPAPPRRSRTMSMAMYGTGCVAVAVATRFAITGIGLPTWVLPSTLAVMALGVPAILLLKPKHSFGGGVVAASALLLVVAGYMTLRALGIGPVGSLFAEGVMKEKDYVVISDFRAVHADSTFGAMLAEAVRTGLAQSKAISVVSVEDVDSALVRLRHDPRAPLDLRTARDVAVREGAKAVVDGDVSGVAGGYIVSLRLVAAEDGRELAAFHAAANSPQALIETADGLVRDLRAKVGESLRTVNAMPELYNQTTSSIDALKEFTLGISAGRAGNYEQAAEHYREATRLDSTFAMAWLNLSSILYDIEQRPAGGDSAQYRAYLLRDRLSQWERLLVTGTYLGLPYQRDPAGAIDAFQQMVDEGDSSQLGKLGTLLLNQRAYERAEPLIRAGMRAHPIRGGGLNLSAVLFNEGKIKDARAVFDSTYQLLPHNPLAARWAAEFAYQAGDLAGASRIADSLATSKAPAQRVWGLRRLGDLALLRGQRSRFERYWHDAEAVDVARGNAPAPQDSAIQFAYAEAWMSPTPSDAAAHLETALVHTPMDTSTSIDDYILATEVYALAGRPDRARAVLARYDALAMDSISRRLADPDRHRMLGDIALAEKHWPQAIAELKRSDSTAAGVPYGI